MMRPVARILLAAFRSASFFACFAAVPSRPAAAAELMSAAHASIRAAEAGQHVTTLADDAFEGREGGSRGGRAAGTYIVEQLQKLGLEPAGDAGGFYQSFGGMRNILGLLRGSDRRSVLFEFAVGLLQPRLPLLQGSGDLIAMLTGVTTWYRAGGPMSRSDVAEAYAAMALRAAGAPG